MKLCLGTVQFGLDYGIQGNKQPKEEKVFEMLSFAIDSGITMLDTASAYGEAEELLGKYFRAFPEKKSAVGIVSKLKPDAFAETDTGDWAEIAVQNARKSLERIGVSKLEAYLFHNASFIFDINAVHALNEVKRTGLAERIGVSVYSPDEAMKALDYPEIGVIQIPYNLFDHRLDKCGFFEKAKEQGVIVFARSSLLQGLIMMDPDNLPDKVRFAKEYLIKLHRICNLYHIDLLDIAVDYVGSKDGIDYVVFGVDDLMQLKQYLSLSKDRLPEEIMALLESTFQEVEERLVNPVLWR